MQVFLLHDVCYIFLLNYIYSPYSPPPSIYFFIKLTCTSNQILYNYFTLSSIRSYISLYHYIIYKIYLVKYSLAIRCRIFVLDYERVSPKKNSSGLETISLYHIYLTTKYHLYKRKRYASNQT